MPSIFPTIAARAAAALLEPGAAYAPGKVEAVDGDTLRVDGVNVRISNLDTPERGGHAACDAERFLAAVAARRADTLVRTTKICSGPKGAPTDMTARWSASRRMAKTGRQS